MRHFIFTLALVVTAVSAQDALAQRKLEATYTISVARIPVGTVVATADISENEYSVLATARITGAMRVLTTGDGSSVVRGTVMEGRLIPSTFSSRGTFRGIPPEVDIEFEDGNVKKLETVSPSQDRVPLTEAHRRGIVDPLTAMLIPAGHIAVGLNENVCGRTMPVFDGYQRYNLSLAFKRIENVKVSEGYAGQGVVCSVRYKPIGGHRPSASLLNLLSSREIEVALAPVVGTHVMAPIRISIESMLANLVVQADRFAAKAQE